MRQDQENLKAEYVGLIIALFCISLAFGAIMVYFFG